MLFVLIILHYKFRSYLSKGSNSLQKRKGCSKMDKLFEKHSTFFHSPIATNNRSSIFVIYIMDSQSSFIRGIEFGSFKENYQEWLSRSFNYHSQQTKPMSQSRVYNFSKSRGDRLEAETKCWSINQARTYCWLCNK